ncbi:MAG: HK97 family phage prohead protease [Clostridiales bacterium]|nr:HK97 family phage prohead protease [Clostridiales bacterium]
MTKKENNKNNSDIKKKILRIKVKADIKTLEKKGEKDLGIVEAYVSIFNNIDLDGDIIKQGAFKESLKAKLPKGVWMHDWNLPIAKTLKAEEDERGLFIRAQFNLETQRGKEAYSDIKFGIIDEFSIGFKVLDFEWDENDNRIIKKVKLYEWSPVLAGANPETQVIDVKTEKEEKINYVDIDCKKKRVKIYFNDGTIKRIKLSNKYIKYLKSLADQKGKKVDSSAVKKVLRIRQVVKQIDKGAEYLLRITK